MGFIKFNLAIVVVVSLVACGGSSSKPPKDPQSSSPSSSSSTAVSSKSSVASSSSSSQAASSIPFTLTSTSFVADGSIPIKYTCNGTEVSPQLKWDITSDVIKSFVLIVDDIDAIPVVGYRWVHWSVYNIPAAAREIVEGATLHAMPAGSIEGVNEDKVPKYSGSCPIDTPVHHYYFSLYAMNTESVTVDANQVMRKIQFENQFASNIIQKVELIGLYQK